MSKIPLPAEVHECPKCHFRWPSPIKGAVMWCPNRHRQKGRNLPSVQMKLVWNRSQGGDPPVPNRSTSTQGMTVNVQS